MYTTGERPYKRISNLTGEFTIALNCKQLQGAEHIEFDSGFAQRIAEAIEFLPEGVAIKESHMDWDKETAVFKFKFDMPAMFMDGFETTVIEALTNAAQMQLAGESRDMDLPFNNRPLSGVGGLL